MHSCILDLDFGGFKFLGVFEIFCEIIGLDVVDLMLYVHALHSHCISTLFMPFKCVFYYCWLYVGRFGLDSAHDVFKFYTSYVHAFFMHTYFLFFSLFLVVMVFSLSLFLSLIDCAMAPKARKSTPAWNPLGYRSSSSNPIPPLHVWFHDEKARKDFLENFQKRGVHLELHVILLDFSDTLLPVVIWTQGWESLLESPLRYLIVFIQEFYSNIHDIDTSVPRFTTAFRGTRIVVTPDLISKVLHVSQVVHLDYLGYEHLRTASRDKLLSHFYETPSIWGGKKNTPCSGFAKGPRFHNMVMTFTLTPLSHYNSIMEPRAHFLLSLLKDLSIDFHSRFITSVNDVYQDTTTCDELIFLVRTYLIHLLGTYVTILCNWLIFWQKALYLYLGRSRMCLILQETVFHDQVLKSGKSVQDSS